MYCNSELSRQQPQGQSQTKLCEAVFIEVYKSQEMTFQSQLIISQLVLAAVDVNLNAWRFIYSKQH